MISKGKSKTRATALVYLLGLMGGDVVSKTYKIWSSCMDGCSCSLCAKLEGTALPLDEPFIIAGRSVQAPPLHVGCRCALMYHEKPTPAPVRAFEAFISFLSIANESVDFFAAVNGYHAALFFLRRLSSCPDAELGAAGLKTSRSFEDELASLIANRDAIFNGAIARAYDRVVRDAASLKTEKGRRARVDRLLQLIASSQELSPANLQFIRSISEGVPV